MIKITAPARIHITLIDLGDSGYRRNGGIGFSINGFDSAFEIEEADEICLNQLSRAGYNFNEISKIRERVLYVANEFPGRGFRLVQSKIPPRHYGFGSGTATALALIEAYKIVNGLGFERHEIVRMSGRGGASGIGVSGYFDGGFILDSGRRFDNFAPTSSDAIDQPHTLPVTLARYPMPLWPIGILIPPKVNNVELNEEVALFRRVVPLTNAEVAEVAYHSVFGVYTSVVENDFSSFCRAINAIQQCKWKSSEISLYGNVLLESIESLKRIGADAVGMSSIGPALYFFADDFERVYAAAVEIFQEGLISRVTANNLGRIIKYA